MHKIVHSYKGRLYKQGCSIDPLVRWSCVNHLKGNTCTSIKNWFGSETFVFVITICNHALAEASKLNRALFLKDILTRWAIIFSCKSIGVILNDTYVITTSEVRVDFLLVPPKLWTIFSIGMCKLIIIILNWSPVALSTP